MCATFELITSHMLKSNRLPHARARPVSLLLALDSKGGFKGKHM